MAFQSFEPLGGHSGNHFQLAKLLGEPVDLRGPFARQVEFLLAQWMQRKGTALSKQPPDTGPEFTPTYHPPAPEKPKEFDLAGHSGQQGIVDVEERRNGSRRSKVRQVIEHWIDHSLVVHDVGAIR
jgi:hypothetical protein